MLFSLKPPQGVPKYTSEDHSDCLNEGIMKIKALQRKHQHQHY